MKWTLREASEELGISVKALRYRIKKHDLEPEMEEGAHGRRYVLTEEQMKCLGTVPSASDEDGTREMSRNRPQKGPKRVRRDGPQDSTQKPTEDRSQDRLQDGSQWVPFDVYRETQEVLKEALLVSREQREDRLEAERRAEEAEEDALRMARRVEALVFELGTQRNLLAENAESLQEDRAMYLQMEAQAKEAAEEVDKAKLEIEALRTELAAEKKEKEELLAKKRRPWWKMRWVV